MEGRYRDVLPRGLQLLVDEIETSARAPVVVEEDPTNCTEMAAMATVGRPTVIIRGQWDATSEYHTQPYQPVLHELLHLRRAFVEGVPALEIRGIQFADADTADLANIHNALEHCIIDRRHEQYGFPPPVWDMRDVWGLPVPTGISDLARRWCLVGWWLQTHFLSNDESREAGRKVMAAAGMADTARFISGPFKHVLRHPEAARMAVAGMIGIPLERAWLRYVRPPAAVSLASIGPVAVDVPGGGQLVFGLAAAAKPKPKMPSTKFKRRHGACLN